MKILFYQWHSFMNKGIENALKRLGIEVDVLFYQQDDWEEDRGLGERLGAAIDRCTTEGIPAEFGGKTAPVQISDSREPYELVFSVNFAPVVSDVCESKGIRYVSWIYDSPVHLRNLSPMRNSCNDIYIFDRGEAEVFGRLGIKVKYMPLAVDTDVFQPALKQGFTSDITLVGSMYDTLYQTIVSAVGEGERGFLDGVIAAQSAVSGGYLIDEVISEDVLERINKSLSQKTKFRLDRRELTYMLACEVTHRQRFLAASLLSSHFSFDLFSTDKPDGLDNVIFRGYADYYTDMPAAFSASRINLNIPLVTIRTGVSLRVIDVLGCGGFLISGMQPELYELFDVGSELVIYEDIEDLYEKSAYYLSHEEERLQIARNGYERVKRDFTFDDRLSKMFF